MMPRITACVIAGLVCCSATAAMAETGSNAPPDFLSSSLKALGALLIVLLLIILVAWAARRYLPFLSQTAVRGEGIRIVSFRMLGPKRSVHLLEVEGSKILVGSSENGITLLKEFGSGGKRE